MRRPCNTRYPWTEWMANEVNEHTSANPRAFRNYLYTWAKKHDLWANATIDGDTVRFTLYKTQEDYDSRRQYKADVPERDFQGRFLGNEEMKIISRVCVICNNPLPPLTPEDSNECWKFDFSTGTLAKVHA